MEVGLGVSVEETTELAGEEITELELERMGGRLEEAGGLTSVFVGRVARVVEGTASGFVG